MSGAAGPRKQSTGLGGRAGAPPGPFVPFVLWGRLTEADRQYKIKKTAENSNTGALGAIPG